MLSNLAYQKQDVEGTQAQIFFILRRECLLSLPVSIDRIYLNTGRFIMAKFKNIISYRDVNYIAITVTDGCKTGMATHRTVVEIDAIESSNSSRNFNTAGFRYMIDLVNQYPQGEILPYPSNTSFSSDTIAFFCFLDQEKALHFANKVLNEMKVDIHMDGQMCHLDKDVEKELQLLSCRLLYNHRFPRSKDMADFWLAQIG
jgi:hypothetical protein